MRAPASDEAGSNQVAQRRARRPPVAVVVTHFNPRLGQRVEWQHPRDFVTEGVEFKAMPSGFDTCEQDFVFFRHHGLWALACFHRRQTDNDSEREVRMRSVALFSTDLAALQASQLATQLLAHAKRLNGSPEATMQLFDLFKPPTHQRPPPSGENGAALGLLEGQLGGGQYLLGGGQLLGLTRQLRARIFTLWKALLLGRRVLFYAPPPVGRLCERALSAHQLTVGWAGCCAPHAAPRTELLLYVGLNDEQELLQRSPHAGIRFIAKPEGGGEGQGYVACTTDRLLADKSDTWDVFIDDRGALKVGVLDARALTLSATDEARYKQLSALLSADGAPSDDRVTRYFATESATLLQGLRALVEEGVTEVLPKHLKRLHLGDNDATFLRLLVAQHDDIRLTVKVHRFRCC